jgi:hypothetical protein
MAAVQFKLHEDLHVPEGSLFDVKVIERLTFERCPIHGVGGSIAILSSHELQELLDEEVQNILLAATQDGVDAARFDEDERSDSEDVN